MSQNCLLIVTLNYLEMVLKLEGLAAPLVGALELSQLRAVGVIGQVPLKLCQIGKLFGANCAGLEKEKKHFIIKCLIMFNSFGTFIEFKPVNFITFVQNQINQVLTITELKKKIIFSMIIC
jgi:hypothetical protein